MSDDSLFYAGLAGGRQNAIDEKNAALGEWQQHSHQLERKITALNKRLRKVNEIAKDWQEQAVMKDAQMVVAAKTFREVTGEGVVDHLGGESEFDRRVKEQVPNSRKAYGLTD